MILSLEVRRCDCIYAYIHTCTLDAQFSEVEAKIPGIAVLPISLPVKYDHICYCCHHQVPIGLKTWSHHHIQVHFMVCKDALT